MTGRRFTEAQVDAGESLRQSVEDRVLTPLGSRPLRPAYGSLATVENPQLDPVVPSIFDALDGDPRVTDVEVLHQGRVLHIFVTGDTVRVEVVVG